MGAMSGTKGIVDKQIKGLGELGNKVGIVLGLFLVEAGVLQHEHIAFLGFRNEFGNFVANAIISKSDGLLEQLAHPKGAWTEAILVLGSVLGTAEVGADGDDGALVFKVLDGGDRATDPSVVSDDFAWGKVK